ncbi:hypothetical protein HRbin36_01313 [bacterium HR36]|nr:hypothetical protein HRbin36_01313 [bacterium HR36]
MQSRTGVTNLLTQQHHWCSRLMGAPGYLDWATMCAAHPRETSQAIRVWALARAGAMFSGFGSHMKKKPTLLVTTPAKQTSPPANSRPCFPCVLSLSKKQPCQLRIVRAAYRRLAGGQAWLAANLLLLEASGLLMIKAWLRKHALLSQAGLARLMTWEGVGKTIAPTME